MSNVKIWLESLQGVTQGVTRYVFSPWVDGVMRNDGASLNGVLLNWSTLDCCSGSEDRKEFCVGEMHFE